MKNLVVSSLIITTFGLNGIPTVHAGGPGILVKDLNNPAEFEAFRKFVEGSSADAEAINKLEESHLFVQPKSSERGDPIRNELDVAFRAGKTYHASLSQALTSLENTLKERLRMGGFSTEKKDALLEEIRVTKIELDHFNHLLKRITDEKVMINGIDRDQLVCSLETESLIPELQRIAGIPVTQITREVKKNWDRDGARVLSQKTTTTVSSVEVVDPYRPGEVQTSGLKNVWLNSVLRGNRIKDLNSDFLSTLGEIESRIGKIERAFVEFEEETHKRKMYQNIEDLEKLAVTDLDLTRSVSRVAKLQEPLKKGTLTRQIDSAFTNLREYALDVADLQRNCFQATEEIIAAQTDAKQIADQEYPVSKQKDAKAGAQPAKLK